VTVYLELDEVLAIHDAIDPGLPGFRDVGAIQSALARPQATAFGGDAYPSIWEKAAALMPSLACNHGWLDGNKRTAWVATMTFLEVNGHPLDPYLMSMRPRIWWSASRNTGYTGYPRSPPSCRSTPSGSVKGHLQR